MSPTTFRDRLEAGKANNHLYEVDDRQGLVSVWKLDDRWIMTWEECPRGQQFDEASYTRDEVHHFASFAALIEFLAARNLTPAVFRP